MLSNCCCYFVLLFCFGFFFYFYLFLSAEFRWSFHGFTNKCATPFLSIDSPVWLFQIRINFIYCNHHCRSDMATMESRVNTSAKVRTSTKTVIGWVLRVQGSAGRQGVGVYHCVYVCVSVCAWVCTLSGYWQGVSGTRSSAGASQSRTRRQQCMPRH